MQNAFEIATGTIPGRNHIGRGNLLTGKNNQDAICKRVSECAIVAVVADGCSQGSYSEVGARLGARIAAEAAIKWFQKGAFSVESPTLWEAVTEDILSKMKLIAATLCPCCESIDTAFCSSLVKDYFLFTIIGVLITPQDTCVFGIGDGVYNINGKQTNLGPYKDNAPPYLGYRLLPALEATHNVVRAEHSPAPDALLAKPTTCNLAVTPYSVLNTDDINSLLIGSDGVMDLIECRRSCIPGKAKQVGDLDRLWSDNRFYGGGLQPSTDSEVDLITPWLRQINSEVVRLENEGSPARLNRDYGLLPDDTSIVVVRRKGRNES